MQTMDSHLASLVRMGKISRALAQQRASVPEELKRLLGDGGNGTPMQSPYADQTQLHSQSVGPAGV